MSPSPRTESGNEQELCAFFGKEEGRKERKEENREREVRRKDRCKRKKRKKKTSPPHPYKFRQTVSLFRFISKGFQRKQLRFLELHTQKWHNPNTSPISEDSRVKARKGRFWSQIWNLSPCWLYDLGTNLSILIQK